jgi:predicted dehydrogenase
MAIQQSNSHNGRVRGAELLGAELRGSEQEPSTVKVGLVGLGYWGPNLLRVLADMPGAEVAWICDLDSDRLERFGRRYPAVRCTGRVEELLDDPTLDAVVIATPVFTHFTLAMRSLAAGKHTFVEKPLAPSSNEAEYLLELAASRALALMCGHTFVYSPPVRAVKAMLGSGELGEVFFISSSRVNLGLHQRDVSVIWDLGPHDFSILLHWLDEMPLSVRAVGRDSVVKGIIDVAFVTLKFPSGVVANVELSWLAPSKLRRTVVVGSQKMVVYDDGAVEPLRLYDHGVVYQDPETFGEYHLSYRTGDILSPKVESHEPLAAEMADFVAAARDGRPMDKHARLASDVVRLAEAAEQSVQNGGREIELERSRPFSMRGRAGRLLDRVPV